MVKNHKFKFIIPVYNNQEYLDVCLESIKNQNYDIKLISIVVIDDFSDQEINTRNLDNITLIRNKKRMYPAYNRFIVYSKAEDNELLIFLDGDDWLTDKNNLNLINKIYSENDIKWSISNHKIFLNDKIKIKPCFVSNEINNTRPKICHLRIGYGYVWNNMPIEWIKKDNKYIKWMTDWNENLWAFNKYGKPFKINCCLSVYNMDTSKTRKENKNYDDMINYFNNKLNV